VFSGCIGRWRNYWSQNNTNWTIISFWASTHTYAIHLFNYFLTANNPTNSFYFRRFFNYVIFQKKRRLILIKFFVLLIFIAIYINLFNSNDGNDDSQIRQLTINGMVATSNTGRRTPQTNFQHQLATGASNITG